MSIWSFYLLQAGRSRRRRCLTGIAVLLTGDRVCCGAKHFYAPALPRLQKRIFGLLCKLPCIFPWSVSACYETLERVKLQSQGNPCSPSLQDDPKSSTETTRVSGHNWSQLVISGTVAHSFTARQETNYIHYISPGQSLRSAALPSCSKARRRGK